MATRSTMATQDLLSPTQQSKIKIVRWSPAPPSPPKTATTRGLQTTGSTQRRKIVGSTEGATRGRSAGITLKRKIASSTEGNNGGKSAGKTKENKPGTVRRGRRPQVGFIPEAEFQRRFKRTISASPSKPLKIPKSFSQYITGDFPQKIVLANVVGDTWRVVLTKWQGRIFIDHGWDEFAELNMLEQGDTLIFTYTIGSSLKVDIFGSNGCEKIPERN